ncbi:MAG: hypothetical protein LC797_13915 [Chloroflexi bacterium]|nr:hypothetical protein [Chloroflexota bacterium]
MSESDRSWDDAMGLGRANKNIIELSRRHCLNMTFVESGGRGAAEASSGLPINMRQIRCPVALGDGMAMNLEWIAIDFYSKHCIGCVIRRPAGDMPNLASLVEERNTVPLSKQRSKSEQWAALHQRWTARTRQRQAVAATADTAMAGALNDIGVLDMEPGREVNPSEHIGARRRLLALADRAPQLFAREVVELGVSLIEEAGIVDLLEVLPHLTRTRDTFAPRILAAATGALRGGAVGEVGRCLAELAGHLTSRDLDVAVLRSLVVLAGAPAEDQLGRRTLRSEANDAAGLRAAADVVPDLVADV